MIKGLYKILGGECIMAKTWYPVVDYVICSECGTCVTKCPHGVYDTRKAP